jgi:hypothetical protein
VTSAIGRPLGSKPHLVCAAMIMRDYESCSNDALLLDNTLRHSLTSLSTKSNCVRSKNEQQARQTGPSTFTMNTLWTIKEYPACSRLLIMDTVLAMFDNFVPIRSITHEAANLAFLGSYLFLRKPEVRTLDLRCFNCSTCVISPACGSNKPSANPGNTSSPLLSPLL